MRTIAFHLLRFFIRQQFPTVRSISTDDLAEWFENSQIPQPQVLDARTEAEFAVSHLKSAQRIDPNQPTWDHLVEHSKDTSIVVYCSVGYRSARVAEQLQQHGFSQVFNLEGSIFQWANEGRSLYHNNQSIQCVHPYNSTWGKLLKAKYRQCL